MTTLSKFQQSELKRFDKIIREIHHCGFNDRVDCVEGGDCQNLKPLIKSSIEKAFALGQNSQATTIIVPKNLCKERLTPKMEREIYWKMRYEGLKKEVLADIKSVLNFLEGNTPREKIVNYIREYLLKNK